MEVVSYPDRKCDECGEVPPDKTLADIGAENTHVMENEALVCLGCLKKAVAMLEAAIKESGGGT